MASGVGQSIEQLMIKKDSATEGSIVLRDLTCEPPVGANYDSATGEIIVGASA